MGIYPDNITTGKRLKNEAHARGWTNEKMAEFLSYSSPKQISPFYSGKSKLSDDRYSMLAKAWGLREEYLKGIDDWKTDDEMLQYARIDDINAFNACKEYLKTIGVVIKLTMFISIELITLYKHWGILHSYFSEKVVNELKQKYDFSQNRANFLEKYRFSGKYLFIPLLRPYDGTNVNFDAIGKKPFPDNNAYQLADEDRKKLIYFSDNTSGTYDASYEIECLIYWENKLFARLDINDLRKFMTKLDSFAKFAVETIMPDMNITHSLYENTNNHFQEIGVY